MNKVSVDERIDFFRETALYNFLDEFQAFSIAVDFLDILEEEKIPLDIVARTIEVMAVYQCKKIVNGVCVLDSNCSNSEQLNPNSH